MENRNCHNFRKYPYNYRMALRIFNEPMAFILRQKPNQQHRCIKMSRRLCVASVAVALVTQQSGVYPKAKASHFTSLSRRVWSARQRQETALRVRRRPPLRRRRRRVGSPSGPLCGTPSYGKCSPAAGPPDSPL